MGTYRDARDLAKRQRERAKGIRRSMDQASREQAELALKEAQKLTSGTTKQATLTAAGHPFRKNRLRSIGKKIARSTKSTFASFPLLPINRQTGDLYRAWRIFARKTGESMVYRLQNMSRHGKFVLNPGGTKNMTDRGFWVELQRRVIPKARKLAEDALKRANRE